MKEGTPDQCKQIRNRRRVTAVIFIGGIFLWFILGDLTRTLWGATAEFAFTMFFWLFGFLGFLVFSVNYWVCPVCKHYFPLGSNGRHCSNCDTHFDV